MLVNLHYSFTSRSAPGFAGMFLPVQYDDVQCRQVQPALHPLYLIVYCSRQHSLSPSWDWEGAKRWKKGRVLFFGRMRGGVLGEKKEERRSGLRTVSAYAKGEVSQIRPWPWEWWTRASLRGGWGACTGTQILGEGGGVGGAWPTLKGGWMHIGEGGLKFNPAVKLDAVHVSALPRRSQETPEVRRVSAPPPSSFPRSHPLSCWLDEILLQIGLFLQKLSWLI